MRCWRQIAGRLSPPLHAKVPVRHFLRPFTPHTTQLPFYSTTLLFSTAPQRPTRAAPEVPSTRITDDDIPPELFDDVVAPVHGDGPTSTGGRVCPHCTFENTNGGNDCEVCGLPL